MNIKHIHRFRHAFDFLILTAIIALGLAGIVYYNFDIAAQIVVTFLMSIAYVFWGIFHHYHDANLTTQVVLEYIAMAVLVSLVLVIFLLRI